MAIFSYFHFSSTISQVLWFLGGEREGCGIKHTLRLAKWQITPAKVVLEVLICCFMTIHSDSLTIKTIHTVGFSNKLHTCECLGRNLTNITITSLIFINNQAKNLRTR